MGPRPSIRPPSRALVARRVLGLSAAAAFLALALLALLADRLASEPAVGSRASLRAREGVAEGVVVGL